MKIHAVFLTSVAAILAGCGGGGGDADRIGDPIIEAVGDYREVVERYSETEGINIRGIPESGRQTYRGRVYGITGTTQEGFSGDFTMEADFDTRDMTGDVRNIVGIGLTLSEFVALADPIGTREKSLADAEEIARSLEPNGERYDGVITLDDGYIYNGGFADALISGEITRNSNQETFTVEGAMEGDFLDIHDENEKDPDRFDGTIFGRLTNEAEESQEFGGVISSKRE